MKEAKYCVVVYTTDEDGPRADSMVFDDLHEALEWANDFYGVVYKLERMWSR